MYRLLVIFSIIAVGECCQCHWGSRAPIDDYFIKVANKVIEADRKAKTQCATRHSTIKEVYGETTYKYAIKIPNGTDSNFVVRSKNRVLLIQGNGSCRSISQIKVLPEMLNYQAATWQFENDELVITVPYAGDNDAYKVCAVPDTAERILPNACKKEIW